LRDSGVNLKTTTEQLLDTNWTLAQGYELA
jgi:hypothetical protein